VDTQTKLNEKEKNDVETFVKQLIPTLNQQLKEFGDALPASFLNSNIYGQIIIGNSLQYMREYNDKARYAALIIGLGAALPDLDKIATVMPSYTIDFDDPKIQEHYGTTDKPQIYKKVREQYQHLSDSPFGKEIISISIDMLTITAMVQIGINRKSPQYAELITSSIETVIIPKDDEDYEQDGTFSELLAKSAMLLMKEEEMVKKSNQSINASRAATILLSQLLEIELDDKWAVSLGKARRHLKSRKSKSFTTHH